ncbi:MAG: 3-dehydroquinate synthase [Chloroflexi bacterium]|nr:3-dehydroquinate synthase [Chloroflexota bacterium]
MTAIHRNMMRNIIITGFMGTGKTVVGAKVARRLGRPFVDMDAEIEKRAGKPVPHIFSEDGETAFRRIEVALCKELSAQDGLVIATGGGALVNPANRAAMMKSGTVVCLTCTAEEILRRVNAGSDADRPLLDVPDPRAEIERLLKARREAYAAVPWQIDTINLSIEEVAARVVEMADIITLPVRHPGGEYPIHIGDGLLARVGAALRATGVLEGSRVAVVSNPVVAPLYGTQVEDSLRSAGFQPFACSVPDGEQHKTLSTIAALYDQFLDGNLDRSGTVLSLGGGVTGDMAGFAAASFMRGVPFAQVPTTILAMADSSVGAKTGVDLPQGKNLVGAFKQPVMVLIDPAVLQTLAEAEIRSGMVETIKHGVIGAPDLFGELESTVPDLQSPISVAQLARSLQVKIDVIEQDPLEHGLRAVLNLGHTVGHALERLSDFSLRHGEAVGIGMVAAARIAVELGWAEPSLVERIEATLSAWGLTVRCPFFDANAIREAMAHDKKRRGRSLRWVLPRAIGEVEITEDVPPDIVKTILQDLGAN